MQFSSVYPRCRYFGSEVEISIAPSAPVVIGTTELHLKVYVNESNKIPKKTSNQVQTQLAPIEGEKYE